MRLCRFISPTARPLAVVIVLAAVALWACIAVRPAAAAEFEIDGITFTLPDGFTIEKVAGPPLVDRPITASFDERGRLYVADSSGSNDPVEQQLRERPHRIVRLEDTNGDGTFDASTVFADRMMFPEGTLWHDGSLYVTAPPSIWKLTDTDGDGVADRREEWLVTTLTGCANDLHGPYLGRDGYIYWAKGAFAEQSHPQADGAVFTSRAAHIFRRHPSGGPVEPVMTGGMDNPVGVAFTEAGERLVTATFLQHPGGGRRDGIIHAIYGGVYGKIHDVLDDHPQTGPVMPVLAHLGPAAPSGLAHYDSGAFGDGYTGNLFAALFNTPKVTRHVLSQRGATFESRDEDFLVADSRDFHPTDVVEDADGSLLVIDTGGWYKLCCPTSQLYKPDVLGAIYRVRRADAPRIDDPRGLTMDWADAEAERLVERLGDERPAVRDRAIAALAGRAGAAVDALRRAVESNADARRALHAVWALTRIEGDAARAAAREALAHADATVRQAALHSIALHRDAEAAERVLQLLSSPDESAHIHRVAAEALGRIGDAEAVPALLEAASRAAADRVLEHSITYALIQINAPDATAPGLAAADPRTRRAAMIALDQMGAGELDPAAVAALLESDDPTLRSTAEWLISKHTDWGPALAGHYRDRLADPGDAEDDRAALADQIAPLSRDAAIQGLLAAAARRDDGFGPAAATIALRAMTAAPLREAPARWVEALELILSQGDAERTRLALRAAGRLPPPAELADRFTGSLLRVARDAELPSATRIAALSAMHEHVPSLDPGTFEMLQRNLSGDAPAAARRAAADVLAAAPLADHQLLALCDSVAAAGPIELPRLLAAFAGTDREQTMLRLIDSLHASSALQTLRADSLGPIFEPHDSPAVQQRARELYGLLDADADRRRANLESMLASLPEGDVRRGQEIFNSERAACVTCHAIGYQGGTLGPDLTTIGTVRTRIDLLEAIVYPSASSPQSYETMQVTMTSGAVLVGIVKQDAADELVLAVGPEQQVRLARRDIADIRPSPVSLMPAGMNTVLTEQELADLLEFLQNTRWR